MFLVARPSFVNPIQFLFVLAVVSVQAALAQPPAETSLCTKLLEPDVTYLISDDKVRLSYFDSLDNTRFGETKANLANNSLLLVNGLPIKNDWTFDFFKQNLETEKRTRSYTYSRDNSTWYYTTRVPADRTQAFVDCIGKFKDDLGLRLTIDQVTDDSVSMRIRWFPDRASVVAITPKYSVLRGGNRITTYPTKLEPFKEYYYEFKRAPNKDFSFVVEGGGRVAKIFVPKQIRLSPPPKATPLATALYEGFICYVQFPQGPNGDDFLNNIYRGPTYSIGYNKLNNSYYTTGANRLTETKLHFAETQGIDPRRYSLNIWDQPFTYDEGGKVISVNPTNTGARLEGFIACSNINTIKKQHNVSNGN